MHSKQSFTQNISLFIVLLFHISGAIGILFSSHRNWFIQNTPLNLCLMALLLIINQKKKNAAFVLFVVISYAAGFGVEWVGVNTGVLFGSYKYGSVLGTSLQGVPLLIGVNWFITMYCAGNVSMKLYNWSDQRLSDAGTTVNPFIKTMSFITDGALLATVFDFVIEPVAVKLGYWHWLPAGNIPFYNYVCWFVISAGLLTVFGLLPFQKNNRLAVHLFIIQLLFFLLLRVFL